MTSNVDMREATSAFSSKNFFASLHSLPFSRTAIDLASKRCEQAETDALAQGQRATVWRPPPAVMNRSGRAWARPLFGTEMTVQECPNIGIVESSNRVWKEREQNDSTLSGTQSTSFNLFMHQKMTSLGMGHAIDVHDAYAMAMTQWNSKSRACLVSSNRFLSQGSPAHSQFTISKDDDSGGILIESALHADLMRPGVSQAKGRARLWSNDEEERFIAGLAMYGRDWVKLASFVGTRAVAAVKSHAQRHFIRLFASQQELPAKVRESGEGYTLSGKPLNPESASMRAFVNAGLYKKERKANRIQGETNTVASLTSSSSASMIAPSTGAGSKRNRAASTNDRRNVDRRTDAGASQTDQFGANVADAAIAANEFDFSLASQNLKSFRNSMKMSSNCLEMGDTKILNTEDPAGVSGSSNFLPSPNSYDSHWQSLHRQQITSGLAVSHSLNFEEGGANIDTSALSPQVMSPWLQTMAMSTPVSPSIFGGNRPRFHPNTLQSGEEGLQSGEEDSHFTTDLEAYTRLHWNDASFSAMEEYESRQGAQSCEYPATAGGMKSGEDHCVSSEAMTGWNSWSNPDHSVQRDNAGKWYNKL